MNKTNTFIINNDTQLAELISDGVKLMLSHLSSSDLVGFMISESDITALLSRRIKAPDTLIELDGGYAWQHIFPDRADVAAEAHHIEPGEMAQSLLRNLVADFPSPASPDVNSVPDANATPNPDGTPNAMSNLPVPFTQALALPPASSTPHAASDPSAASTQLAPSHLAEQVPLLVYIGRHGDHEMLFNLRHAGHLVVRGTAERIVDAMGSFVMDLLSDPRREDLEIHLVGFGYEFAVFPQVRLASKLSDVFQTRETRRRKSESEPPREVVVIAPMAESAEMLGELERAGAFVVSSFGDANWLLELEDRKTSLHPCDIDFEVRLTRAAAELPTETFLGLLPMHDRMDAEHKPGLSAADPRNGAPSATKHVLNQYSNRARASANANADSDTRMDPAADPAADAIFGRQNQRGEFASVNFGQRTLPLGAQALLRRRFRHGSSDDAHLAQPQTRQVRVCVLGPVTVEGLVSDVGQQCLDFMCYLAFNRDGVTKDMIIKTLWPDREPNSHSVTSLVSKSRHALGMGSNGKPLLPRILFNDTYRISPEVTTDYEEFCFHLCKARGNREADLVHLRRALKLVRGAPFDGPVHKRLAWADFSLRIHLECLIDETVHRLADIALQLGDLETAYWACNVAHKVVPGCEQCYLRRFQIAVMQGDKSELRRAMAELHYIVHREAGFRISPWIQKTYISMMQNATWR